MALSTGLATGMSASAGTSVPNAVTAEPTVGTSSASPTPAPGATATPAPEANAPDAKTRAAAQAALQRASVVTAESVAVPPEQVAKIEAQAAAVRELLEARETAGAASRSGERTPLGTTPPADASSEAPAEVEAELTSATESLRTLVDQASEAAVAIEAAPPTPAEILAEQKAAAQQAAPALAAHAGDTAGYANGRVPGNAMCELSFAPGQTLRCDAAEQLERLDAAYAAQFGTHLDITDSYRSYSSQVATRASRGYMAAVPGYSNHGWGIAVDLGGGIERFGTSQYEWMRAHAPAFGWDNPDWARPGGKKPEAWHWEYTPLS